MSKRLMRLSGVAMLVVLAAMLITSLALAYSTDFEDVPSGTPLDGLALPGMTFAAIPDAHVFFEPPPYSTHTSGHVAYLPGGWIEIAFDEPQDYVSFSYAYQTKLFPAGPAVLAQSVPTNQPWIYGELDGEAVIDEQLPPGQAFWVGSTYEGRFTLDQRVDFITIYDFETGWWVMDNIETGVNPVVDPTPEPTSEPTAEPTAEPTEEPAPMLCTTGDGSLNALHCGRPVAVFARGGGFAIYGVDINTGHGALAEEVGRAAIDEAGVPTGGPVVIAEGQNPYNHQPFTLYRLSGGEFQLNTFYWDGKPYVITWAAGASGVDVVEW